MIRTIASYACATSKRPAIDLGPIVRCLGSLQTNDLVVRARLVVGLVSAVPRVPIIVLKTVAIVGAFSRARDARDFSLLGWRALQLPAARLEGIGFLVEDDFGGVFGRTVAAGFTLVVRWQWVCWLVVGGRGAGATAERTLVLVVLGMEEGVRKLYRSIIS